MNTKQLTEKFWDEGFLVLEGFFPEEMMNKFNDKILEHFGMNPDWEHSDEFVQKSATEVVPWFPMREGVKDFEEIDKDPNFMEITRSILGDGWTNLYCMAMYSKKGTKGQAWHQDCPPEIPEQFNLNRLMYTHDISPKNGGQVIVVPGSHKKGVLPAGEPHADIEGQVTLIPKAGDVVFLHGHTWHRVLPVTGSYRVSTNFRAVPRDTPEDITDIAVYRNMRYKFSIGKVIEERK